MQLLALPLLLGHGNANANAAFGGHPNHFVKKRRPQSSDTIIPYQMQSVLALCMRNASGGSSITMSTAATIGCWLQAAYRRPLASGWLKEPPPTLLHLCKRRAHGCLVLL